MDKYYTTINSEMKDMKDMNDMNDMNDMKDMKDMKLKQVLNDKLSKGKIHEILDPSPKTMKRNKSRDNFIKFQWSWIL